MLPATAKVYGTGSIHQLYLLSFWIEQEMYELIKFFLIKSFPEIVGH